MVALPPDDGKTLEQKQLRFGQFAHSLGESAGGDQRATAPRIVGSSGVQRISKSVTGLEPVTAKLPEPHQGTSHPKCRRWSICAQMVEGRAKVGIFAFEPVKPYALLRTLQVRRGLLRHRKEVLGVSVVRFAGHTVFVRSFERERSDRLEHPQPQLAVGVLAAPQQALLGERDQPLDCSHSPDRFGGIDPHTADERRQLSQQTSLGRVEQLVAPADRCAQRALALGKIASALRQRQALSKSRLELSRREYRNACRSKLERQR